MIEGLILLHHVVVLVSNSTTILLWLTLLLDRLSIGQLHIVHIKLALLVFVEILNVDLLLYLLAIHVLLGNAKHLLVLLLDVLVADVGCL